MQSTIFNRVQIIKKPDESINMFIEEADDDGSCWKAGRILERSTSLKM